MIQSSSLMFARSFQSSGGVSKQSLMRIAAWFVDNTSLTFYQIAKCCELTLEEVQNIADEEIEVEKYNPVITGKITEKEIENCQDNHDKIPKLIVKSIKRGKKVQFNKIGLMSVVRRRDKPNAIYYLVKKFPILNDSVIVKLIGTTNHTVEQIRAGTYHNMQNIKPHDPVLLGLCSQEKLELELEKAKVEREKQERLKSIIKY